MADVKWIKIMTDIFDDEKMLLIDGLPERDGIITIWFKLLCMAGKTNNGGVFMMQNIILTDEMLALILRRPLATVRLALQTFEQFGMIEFINGAVTIPNWDKHQSLDSYEKKKARDRLYQQERREKQRLLAENRVTSCDSSCDIVVSEEEIEKDIDIEINNIGGKNAPPVSKSKRFVPPTVDEVKAYCIERNNGIDAEHFVDHYTTNGWKVGKNPMKDWKAAVRTWERRANEFKPTQTKPNQTKPSQTAAFDRDAEYKKWLAKQTQKEGDVK